MQCNVLLQVLLWCWMVSCYTKSLLAQYLIMFSLNTIFCGCEFSIVCVLCWPKLFFICLSFMLSDFAVSVISCRSIWHSCQGESSWILSSHFLHDSHKDKCIVYKYFTSVEKFFQMYHIHSCEYCTVSVNSTNI